MNKLKNTRWLLAIYDTILYGLVSFVMLYLHPSQEAGYGPIGTIKVTLFGMFIIICGRFVFSIYQQIWRYGGVLAYLRLIISDAIFGCVFTVATRMLGKSHRAILLFTIVCVNLLLSMGFRLIYCYFYQYASEISDKAGIIRIVLKRFAGVDVTADVKKTSESDNNKIRVAIVGAGKLGISLASDFNSTPNSNYLPVCFIDIDKEKIGRKLMNLVVLSQNEAIPECLSRLGVQEIIFALPHASIVEKEKLYKYYKSTGCRIRVYDFPITSSASNSKRTIRDFDIEELLPRNTISLDNEETTNYYKDKVVMVTGGGGSIGSELCRQIAAMQPKQLVVVDFAENTTYDLQIELQTAYKWLNLAVEIASVCDEKAMYLIFETYRPNVLLHAAAHKHVPLMEHNCCEAIKNNIFGTKLTAELAIKYGVEKFTLISSDKAVNPTNVMGATKRACEMIIMSLAANNSATAFCAVRFGNVMGSAGSVIPLFKKQIMNGGPITITDTRIIRYFMTISEASHLVLESGAKANNGELFVLDMGQPVKILELAENMIKIAGFIPYQDIDIVETGLRPGEKLYEELLMKSDTLTKTDNDLIFIEKDETTDFQQLSSVLLSLKNIVDNMNDIQAKQMLKSIIPTYKNPSEVNVKVPK